MKYEMMLIIKPMEQRFVGEVLSKVKELVNEVGSIIKVDEWGRRFLAYEIKGETEGYYVLLTFDSEFKLVTILDRKMHQIEEVIRHMIVWKGGEILPDEPRLK